MVSNFRQQGGQNWSDNVFKGLRVGEVEEGLASQFLSEQDFSANTRRAMRNDLRKLSRWFIESNREVFTVKRVTMRDVADFRDHLRREQNQAIASVNRCLVTLRRFFAWLFAEGHVGSNPAKAVKELRKQELAPKGLDRSEVRRLLREVELRQDVRAAAIFTFMLFTGCRVGDLVGLTLNDLILNERGGTAVFRNGKGGKQRSVPIPLSARRALQAYLDVRPPVLDEAVFVGERGRMTDRGVRALCDKYSAITGIKIHPHLLRHTFAHQFLASSGNDLVALAQILGHENLNTTARYSARISDELAEMSDHVNY